MQILIVGALSKELNVIKDKLKNSKRNFQINYLISGMGIYETVFSLTKYLENNSKPDFIINIGICGYKENKLDYIQIGRIIKQETGKELIVPIFVDFGNIETITSSEKIIDNPNLLEENYIDMESRAIEFVANKYKIPRLIIKVPADKIGDETKNFDYKKALINLAENINYKHLLEKICSYLYSIPKSDNYEYLKEKYRFSYQEFEILKQKISKYETLSNKLFIDFYNKNHILNKKDFLDEFYKLI